MSVQVADCIFGTVFDMDMINGQSIAHRRSLLSSVVNDQRLLSLKFSHYPSLFCIFGVNFVTLHVQIWCLKRRFFTRYHVGVTSPLWMKCRLIVFCFLLIRQSMHPMSNSRASRTSLTLSIKISWIFLKYRFYTTHPSIHSSDMLFSYDENWFTLN